MKRLVMGVALLLAVAGVVFAEEGPADEMGIFPALEKLGGTISGVLDSNQVLGTPVKVGDNTLIPVVTKGLGFGLGEGMLGQEANDTRGDKGGSEVTKDRHGIGCGAGGFARPIAIIVVTKEGKVAIHRLQESGLVGVVKELIPVFQRLISQKLDIFKLKMQAGEAKPSTPPGR